MRFASRLDDRLLWRLRLLDMDCPVAETCRALGAHADALGLMRPSYACVRLHVARERVRRAERDAALRVAAELAFTRHIAPTPEAITAAYRRERSRRLR